MAVAAFWPHARSGDGGTEGEAPTAFMQLYGAICAVPSVRRVAAPKPRGSIELWVQLAEDDEEQETLIYRALQEYRATVDPIDIDLHIVFPDEPDNTLPSGSDVLYERR